MAENGAGPQPGAARRNRKPAQLASLTPKLLAPVLARRGFASADLTLHWPEIAGPGVARYSRPLSMQWPKGGADNGLGATLTIACHSAFALDLQQMAPVVLERINKRLGWRCVASLRIRQMPVAPPQPKHAPRMPEEADFAAAGRIAAGIREDKLKEALTRLGAGVLAQARREKNRLP